MRHSVAFVLVSRSGNPHAAEVHRKAWLLAVLALTPGCGLLLDSRRDPRDGGLDATDTVPPLPSEGDAPEAPDAALAADTPSLGTLDGGEVDPDAGFDSDLDAGSDAGQDAGSDAGQDAGSDAGQDGGSDAAAHDAGIDATASDAGDCARRLCAGDAVPQLTLAAAADIDVSEDGQFVMLLQTNGAGPVIEVRQRAGGTWTSAWSHTHTTGTCSVAAMSDDGEEVLANCTDGLRRILRSGTDTRLAPAAPRTLAAGGSQFAVGDTRTGHVALYEAGVALSFAVGCTPPAMSWLAPGMTAGSAISMRSEPYTISCGGLTSMNPSFAVSGARTGMTGRMAASSTGPSLRDAPPDSPPDIQLGADVAFFDGLLATTASVSASILLTDAPPLGVPPFPTLSVSLGSFDVRRPMVGWVQAVSGTTTEAWIRPWTRAGGPLGGSTDALRLRFTTSVSTQLVEMRISDCQGARGDVSLTAVLRGMSDTIIYRVRCPGSPP